VTIAPETPSGDQSLWPNSGLQSNPDSTNSLAGQEVTDRSLWPWVAGVSSFNTSGRNLQPESKVFGLTPDGRLTRTSRQARGCWLGQISRPKSPGHRGWSLRPGEGNNFILWRLSPPLLTSLSNPLNYGALNTKLDFKLRSFHLFGEAPASHRINLESLQILISRLIRQMLLTNTKTRL
jgi:hypothetical protein